MSSTMIKYLKYHPANSRSTAVYDITYYNDNIQAVVTCSATVVDRWINEITRIHRRKLHKLVIGIDTEWRLNANKSIAILQLCVGRRCLIFQLHHAQEIPASLYAFLNNTNFTFVGVGIGQDVQKLSDHRKLSVGGCVKDLQPLAASVYNDKEFEKMGLKRMASAVLGKVMDKPKHITLSKWDAKRLSYAQVEYACLDAFVSFEIGMALLYS
ncbi:hypothetical protein LguiA_003707 [Lonicera macranthoides]